MLSNAYYSQNYASIICQGLKTGPFSEKEGCGVFRTELIVTLTILMECSLFVSRSACLQSEYLCCSNSLLLYTGPLPLVARLSANKTLRTNVSELGGLKYSKGTFPQERGLHTFLKEIATLLLKGGESSWGPSQKRRVETFQQQRGDLFSER